MRFGEIVGISCKSSKGFLSSFDALHHSGSIGSLLTRCSVSIGRRQMPQTVGEQCHDGHNAAMEHCVRQACNCVRRVHRPHNIHISVKTSYAHWRHNFETIHAKRTKHFSCAENWTDNEHVSFRNLNISQICCAISGDL